MTSSQPRPRVTIFYHFFHPDDVVSAQHFSDLAEGLAVRGWDVVARPANRSCRDDGAPFPRRESWRGVDVRRVWRPAFRQASHVGRVLNTAWMLAAWSWAAVATGRRRREAVIIGTDPVLSILVAAVWRLLHPRSAITHWCFDLYPEAAVADGMFRSDSLAARCMAALARVGYRRCDLVADIGGCMAQRLQAQVPQLQCETLTPWALVEPAKPQAAEGATREELFGDARLGLLYSGTFGRAHDCDEFVKLARRLRGAGVGFCFAARGNRVEQLRASVDGDDANIRFAGFAPQSQLEERLAACDLHLVSLRPDWTGTVVPSKFFGALAAGRGVVFAGSPDSAIARWIVEHRVGWVLTPDTLEAVAAELRSLAADSEEMERLRQRAWAAYQRHFSKRLVLDRWDQALRRLVGEG